MSWLFASGGPSIGASASVSLLLTTNSVVVRWLLFTCVKTLQESRPAVATYYVLDVKYPISVFPLRLVHSRSLNIVWCLLRGAFRVPLLNSLCLYQWVSFMELLWTWGRLTITRPDWGTPAQAWARVGHPRVISQCAQAPGEVCRGLIGFPHFTSIPWAVSQLKVRIFFVNVSHGEPVVTTSKVRRDGWKVWLGAGVGGSDEGEDRTAAWAPVSGSHLLIGFPLLQVLEVFRRSLCCHLLLVKVELFRLVV